jgi:hypothetical protein
MRDGYAARLDHVALLEDSWRDGVLDRADGCVGDLLHVADVRVMHELLRDAIEQREVVTRSRP